MKRVIEIEDNLQEYIETAVEEFVEEYREGYLDYPQDRIHEILDSSVPIYTHEIRGLWFLYEDEFIEAYEAAGIGDNPKENEGMTAIYLYMEQEFYELLEENYPEIYEKL